VLAQHNAEATILLFKFWRLQVLGLHHRMFTDGSAAGFTGSAGFNGIVTALFGGLHPLGTIPASVLFGGLLVGANKLQRTVQVPSALAIALNGLVVVFVVATQIWTHRRRLQAIEPEPTPTPAAEDKAVIERTEVAP